MASEHADQRWFKGREAFIRRVNLAGGSGGETAMNSFVKTAMALAIASAVTLPAVQSVAATFAAWEVANVPFGDTLNVRKFPSSGSQKQGAYPNGTVLQMTGRCTGGVNLLDIANQLDWKQKQKVRQRWCEVWHDPAQNGNFVTGWVYGKYIAPH